MYEQMLNNTMRIGQQGLKAVAAVLKKMKINFKKYLK